MKQPKPLPNIPLAHIPLPARASADPTSFFSDTHENVMTGPLSFLVAEMIEKEGWSFSCADEPGQPEIVLKTSEVASPDTMMPLIIREASKIMTLALGSSPNIRWVENPKALCLLSPDAFQENTASLSIWASFCHYAMETLQGASPKSALEGEPASMTAWREAFFADIDRGELRPVTLPTIHKLGNRSGSDI